MDSKQYSYEGRIYSVLGCKEEDIPSHIERVCSYWKSANADFEAQRKMLELAVLQDTAFKVVDDTGETKAVIYYVKDGIQSGVSYLLWFENKRMAAMLCYYLRLTANLLRLTFMPHTRDYIPFRFLVQEASIRLFHSHRMPLLVDLYSKKSQILYEDHFKRYGIKEL